MRDRITDWINLLREWCGRGFRGPVLVDRHDSTMFDRNAYTLVYGRTRIAQVIAVCRTQDEALDAAVRDALRHPSRRPRNGAGYYAVISFDSNTRSEPVYRLHDGRIGTHLDACRECLAHWQDKLKQAEERVAHFAREIAKHEDLLRKSDNA